MDSEVVEILKEIRDETKQTNARLDQTNARLDQTNTRLESLEGSVEFLERRVSKGFEELNSNFNMLVRQQAASELRLVTEVVSLAKLTREVRDVITQNLDDHKLVLNLEKRVSALEKRNGRSK